MLDTYLFGNVNRISPEAPVPIVQIEHRESRPGGAANVAMNLKSLGANVSLCSVTGNDEAGEKLKSLLKKSEISSEWLISGKSRPTTEKTRVISRSQQMLRYDAENEEELSENDERFLLQMIEKLLATQRVDVLIFQDYNKGVLTKNVIHTVTQWCEKKNIPVAVDPKKLNFFEYRGVKLFKPNLREINEALQADFNKHDLTSLVKADHLLKKQLQHEITLITLSEGGVFITDHHHHEIIPASVRQVADVSGAGDTVLSIAALGVALQLDLKTIGILSNLAAGIACGKLGVVPVSSEELKDEIYKIEFI